MIDLSLLIYMTGQAQAKDKEFKKAMEDLNVENIMLDIRYRNFIALNENFINKTK